MEAYIVELLCWADKSRGRTKSGGVTCWRGIIGCFTWLLNRNGGDDFTNTQTFVYDACYPPLPKNYMNVKWVKGNGKARDRDEMARIQVIFVLL